MNSCVSAMASSSRCMVLICQWRGHLPVSANASTKAGLRCLPISQKQLTRSTLAEVDVSSFSFGSCDSSMALSVSTDRSMLSVGLRLTSNVAIASLIVSWARMSSAWKTGSFRSSFLRAQCLPVLVWRIAREGFGTERRSNLRAGLGCNGGVFE